MVENPWGNRLHHFVDQRTEQSQPSDFSFHGHVNTPRKLNVLAVDISACRTPMKTLANPIRINI